jgi:hypothetical protein
MEWHRNRSLDGTRLVVEHHARAGHFCCLDDTLYDNRVAWSPCGPTATTNMCCRKSTAGASTLRTAYWDSESRIPRHRIESRTISRMTPRMRPLLPLRTVTVSVVWLLRVSAPWAGKSVEPQPVARSTSAAAVVRQAARHERSICVPGGSSLVRRACPALVRG